MGWIGKYILVKEVQIVDMDNFFNKFSAQEKYWER